MTIRIALAVLTCVAAFGCGSSSSGESEVQRSSADSATAEAADLSAVGNQDWAEKDAHKAGKIDDIMHTIATDTDLGSLYQARSRCAEHLDAALPRLVEMLTIDKHIGLTNTADLIIFERIENGDLQFYGHGHVVADDLFTLSGRASWLLKELTRQELGVVGMKTTTAERLQLQKRWRANLKNREKSGSVTEGGR